MALLDNPTDGVWEALMGVSIFSSPVLVVRRLLEHFCFDNHRVCRHGGGKSGSEEFLCATRRPEMAAKEPAGDLPGIPERLCSP